MHQAEELGINCFDTAASYGDSEAVLGRYFKQHPRPGRQIVTKFKLDPSISDSDAELENALRSQLEKSLQNLGTQRIPIYLLHQASDLHRYQKRLVNVLERLVRENLIGMAGVSIYTKDDLDQMMQHEVFQATQIPINLFDQRLIRSGHLDLMKERGIIVFARSVFLQGLFFMDPTDLPVELAGATPFLLELNRFAAQEQLSVAQLALSFVRDLPGITSLVVGSETTGQIRQNVTLAEGPPLSEKGHATAISTLFDNIPEIVYNPNYCPAIWQR